MVLHARYQALKSRLQPNISHQICIPKPSLFFQSLSATRSSTPVSAVECYNERRSRPQSWSPRKPCGETKKLNALNGLQMSTRFSSSCVPARDRPKKALKIRFPDSRIHVYCSDKDCVESYDWGPDGRFPTAHFWDPNVRSVRARKRLAGFSVVIAVLLAQGTTVGCSCVGFLISRHNFVVMFFVKGRSRGCS